MTPDRNPALRPYAARDLGLELNELDDALFDRWCGTFVGHRVELAYRFDKLMVEVRPRWWPKRLWAWPRYFKELG
jgi:hypothetical protein